MIFAVFGTDHYRVAEKLKELKSGFIQKRDKAGLNIVNLNGEELTLAQFQQEVLTRPFLGDKKMIVIKNLLINKKTSQEIVDFIEHNKNRLDNVICFVDFIDPEKSKTDKKNKLSLNSVLFKYLSQQEYFWEFNLMKIRDLENWITRYASQNSIQIESAAVSELTIKAGNDLFQVVAELTKLSALKTGEKISKNDVRTTVSNKFDDNIFDLVDSLGDKNTKMALKLIAKQLNFGSHPLAILAMMARQFKIILKTKDNWASASKLNLHPFVFTKAKKQGQNFTPQKITGILSDLLRIEEQLKCGEKNPELLFNLFIIKNC